MIDILLCELYESLKQSNNLCTQYFQTFIQEYKKDIENKNNYEINCTVYCLLEDLEFLDISPSLSTIFENGDVALDRVDISEEADRFFSEKQFMPQWYQDSGYDLCEEYSELFLENQVKTIALNWFRDTWDQANLLESLSVPLYFTEHFTNNVIMNLSTSEKIVLF
jgi:hypothetical protein